MSDNAELSISELRRKRAQSTGGSAANPAPPESANERPAESVVIETHPRPAQTAMVHAAPAAPMAPQPRPPSPPAEEGGFNFDFIQLIETARSHWKLLTLATILIAALGCAAGYLRANYLVRLTLTLRDLSTRFVPTQDTEAYRPPQLSSQTLVDFLVSPELLRYVSTHAEPKISEKKLRARLTIDQEKDSQTIMVTLAGKNEKALVALANLYVTSAIEKSRESQMENPSLTYTNFKNSLTKTETEQATLNARLGVIRTNSGIIDPVLENSAYEKQWTDLQLKIDVKQGELEQLEARENLLKDEPLKRSLLDAEARLKALQRQGMRDEHPDVKRVRTEINDLSRQLKESTSNEEPPEYSSFRAETALKKKTLEVDLADLKNQAAVQRAKIDKLYESAGEFNQLKAKLDLLDKFHKMVESRMFEAQQYRDNAEGYYKVPTVSTAEDVDVRTRYVSVVSFGVKTAVGGFIFTLGLIVLVENINPRLKTAADVKRATRLPVLAALGDLNKMDAAARKAWAFRTWTILSGTLVQSANRGTVCGIISCSHGEGRTTWIELLVDAARQRGFEVTKLDFRHVAEKAEAGASQTSETADKSSAPAAASSESAVPPSSTMPATVGNQAVSQAKAASVIHVQLPGMVWDLERRIQFQEELDKWQSVTKAVILIDLPPASVPEAVLLAENLPQVLWLVDSGKSTARETRLHLETLRHARCKLVGAVLNHEPEPLIKL